MMVYFSIQLAGACLGARARILYGLSESVLLLVARLGVELRPSAFIDAPDKTAEIGFGAPKDTQ